VNVIQELNENIIGIDFIHAHKLTYNVISRRVKFSGAGTNSIVALKHTVLPAMTSTVVKAKFKGTRDEKATYVANICAPRTAMVSGMASIMNVDENNICNIVVENCPLYDVMLKRDNILRITETEEEELVPLTDDFISSVCQDIHNRFPKVKRKRLSREDIKQRCHLQVPEEFQERYLDILCKHQDILSVANITWAWLKISNTKYISRRMIRSTGSNSRSWKRITNTMNKLWMNG
jgi:superfamily II helicase